MKINKWAVGQLTGFFITLSCSLSLPAVVAAQELTGLWKGRLPQNDKPYVFTMEADISQRGNALIGQAKYTTDDGSWAVLRFEGSINGTALTLKETRVIREMTRKSNWGWCLKNLSGVLKVGTNALVISGSWVSTRVYQGGAYSDGYCAPGQFTLSKALPPVPPPASRRIAAPASLKNAAVNEVVTLKNVLFETSKDVLLPASRPELEQLAQLLQAHPLFKIRIDGHTDKIGNAAKNLTLSQRRAQAVKQYLVNSGIAETRIFTAGYGDTRTICPAPCEANRRVEFMLSN